MTDSIQDVQDFLRFNQQPLVKIFNQNRIIKSLFFGNSLTSAISCSDLYGFGCIHAVKSEVKILIGGNPKGRLIVCRTPLIDDKVIKPLRSKEKKFKYLHIGAITISIQSLLLSGVQDIRGAVAVIDSSMGCFEDGCIFSFDFHLENQHAGSRRADFLAIPNGVIPIDCPRSLQILLVFEGVDVVVERDCFAADIGIICSPSNATCPSKRIGAGSLYWPVMNAGKNGKSTFILEMTEMLKNAYNGKNLDLERAGDDECMKTRGLFRKSFTRRIRFRARKDCEAGSISETGESANEDMKKRGSSTKNPDSERT